MSSAMLPNLSGMNTNSNQPPTSKKRRVVDPSDWKNWSGIVGDPIRNSENDVVKTPPFKLLPNHLKLTILKQVALAPDSYGGAPYDQMVCDRISRLCYAVTKDTKPGESNQFASPWINCDDDSFWDEINYHMGFYKEPDNEKYKWAEFRRDRMNGKVVFMEQTDGFLSALANHNNELPPWASRPPSTPKEYFQYMCRKVILTEMSVETYIDLLTDYRDNRGRSYLDSIFEVFSIPDSAILERVFIPRYKKLVIRLSTFQDEIDTFSYDKLKKDGLKDIHEGIHLYKRFRERYRLDGGNEVAIGMVKIDPFKLNLLEYKWKDDEEVVYAAVLEWSHSMRFASDRLKGDKMFLLIVVYGFLENRYEYYKVYEGMDSAGKIFFEYINPSMLEDDEFMRVAIKLDGSLLSVAPDSIKNDYEFVKQIVIDTNRTNSFSRLPAHLFASPVVIEMLRKEGYSFPVIENVD